MAPRLQKKSDDRVVFLQQFLKNPRQVGSVIPSSRYLERRVVALAEIATARTIVELGTGTGGMTRSFNPSIDIYQIPESGMALQASWGGTVYTVDSALR